MELLYIDIFKRYLNIRGSPLYRCYLFCLFICSHVVLSLSFSQSYSPAGFCSLLSARKPREKGGKSGCCGTCGCWRYVSEFLAHIWVSIACWAVLVD